MTWPAAWRDENNINAHNIVGPRVARAQRMGRGSHAFETGAVNRKIEIGWAGARFDFDKGDRPPASCDEINLTLTELDAPRDNPPAVQCQPKRRATFTPMPAFFGGRTLHLSASAR